MRNYLAICLTILASISILACSRGPSRREVAAAYEASYNAGDIDSVLALGAPDILAEFTGMGPPLAGKDELRGKLEYDTTLDARLTLNLLRARGDSVIYTAREANAWLSAAGLPPYEYSQVVFTIKAGKIESMRFELSDPSVSLVNDLMRELIPWARDNRSGEFSLMISDEPPYFSAEKARAALLLARDWRRESGESTESSRK